jgi:hypothetical protein
VLFGYRIRRIPDQKHSPFYLLYGVEPTLPIDIKSGSDVVKFSIASRLVELNPLFALRHDLIRSEKHNDEIPKFIVCLAFRPSCP